MYASSRLSNQSGQALIETLICAMALTPLLTGAIYIAKLQSIQMAAIAASRALAFECQVSVSACADLQNNSALLDELRRRHFMHPAAPLESNQQANDSASESDKQVLWTTRSGQPLLASYADVGFRVDADVLNAGSSNAGRVANSVAVNAMNAVSNLAGPGQFGLNWQGGLIDAKVQASISKGQSLNAFLLSLDPIALDIKAHTATLTDAWNSSSAQGNEATSTQSRVDIGKRLPILEPVVDGLYAATRAFIVAADALGFEPDGSKFKYHEVDVSLIPADRKPGYVAPASGGGYEPGGN